MAAKLDKSRLRPLEIFRGVSDDGLDSLLALAQVRRYASGDTVFLQGGQADRFFVLLDGRLRVTRINADGQQTIVRMVSPGDLFGIAQALRRNDYPGTATAVMDSTALAWPMTSWDPILQQYQSFAVNAMQTMGQRLQEAHLRVQELSTEAVERRVAHTVLRLASQSGKKEGHAIRIDFPVSKQDIAEMAGTTLHTVSRILTAWEAADLVEGGRQKLLIKNPHRLLLIGDGEVPGLL